MADPLGLKTVCTQPDYRIHLRHMIPAITEQLLGALVTFPVIGY